MNDEYQRAKAYVDTLWQRRASERRLDALLAGDPASRRLLREEWKPLTQERTMPPMPSRLYGTLDDDARADRAN